MIDYGSDIGRVRLNITDIDEAAFLLTDEQIQALLDQSNDSVNMASYRALRLIAMSELLVSKKIRTQDLSSDGPAVAAGLMSLAAHYKEEADAEGDGTIGYVSPSIGGHLEAEEWRLGPFA